MRMFDNLMERTERRTAAKVGAVLDGAELAFAGFRGIAMRREAGRIVLSGRRLFRLWLDDARLRFAMWGRR